MQSHQLNAIITERPPVKVATSQICSDLVYGKSGSIVGDPSFIKTMVARVIFSNYMLQMISDKGKTQATLHSRFAQVGEYPFSSSSLHFLTRISYGNFFKQQYSTASPNLKFCLQAL